MVQMGDPEMLWKRADSARDGKRVQKVPRGGLKVGGHLINAPAGYETYLHTLYGDYHQLPPEDQRHPAHVGDAYWR